MDFLKIGQKGGGIQYFWFNKGRDTKKGCNKGGGDKENLLNFFNFFKGNPNFQGILSWILQILHYYCRKQHKNIENSQINEQNVVLSLCPSLFTATCAPFTFISNRVFSVPVHSIYSAKLCRILNISISWFENVFLQVKPS